MKITEQQLKRLLYPELYPPASIAQIRAEICEHAQQIFGRPVLFEERAFQALEVTTAGGNTPNAVHVWSQLSNSLPAITALYEALDISIERWPDHPRRLEKEICGLGEIEWSRTLRGIFMRGKNLTNIGQHVARTGLVTVRDLVISLFQASRQIGRSCDAGDYLRTSLPFRYMSEKAGAGDSTYWSNQLDSFALKAAKTFDKLYSFDPSVGVQQFILYHDGRGVRIQPFGVSGIYRLQEAPLPDGSLWIARGNVIQPATRFSAQAIEALEELINRQAKEKDFQVFFEENPEFLLTVGDYVSTHPQLVLSEDEGNNLIPDFFLEKMDSGFCDICDLKRPSTELIRHQKNRRRFRDAVMEAVAQVTTYKDWFDDRAHRDLFYQRYGLKAFKPRVVVVIGRRASFSDDIERLSLEAHLPNWVTLKTYDEIVSGARRWRRIAQGAN